MRHIKKVFDIEKNKEHLSLQVVSCTDLQGQETERRVLDSDGRLTLQTFFTYHGSGKLSGSIAKNGSGKILNYIEYSYDDKGRLVKRAFFNSEGQLLAYHAWLYDLEADRLLEYCKYDNTQTFKFRKTFHYNEQGLITEERHYSSLNKLVILKKKQYDDNGLEKGEFIYDGSDNLKARKLIIRNRYGKPIEISWYDPSDRIQRLECFEYHDNNLLDSEIIIDFFGKRSFFKHYTEFGKIEHVMRKQNRQPVAEEEYEYDSEKRLTVRKRYLIKDKKRTIIEKEMHYYET